MIGGKLKEFQTMGRVVRHNTRGDLGFGVEFIGPNMRLLLAAVGKGGQEEKRTSA